MLFTVNETEMFFGKLVTNIQISNNCRLKYLFDIFHHRTAIIQVLEFGGAEKLLFITTLNLPMHSPNPG